MADNKIIQKQMNKFGWKEGNGLGKDQQGLKEAIKISVKNNKNGLGLDLSEQYVFHWWDHAFNKVASSIMVKNSGGEVTISKRKNAQENGTVSSKRPTSIGAGKELLYGRFVRSGMTVIGNKTVGVVEKKSSTEDCVEEESRDFSNKNSLERAFEMSGGRTAHAAARHGHKLSGKLKRLHDQENGAFCAPKEKKSFETQTTIEEYGIELGRESIEEKSNAIAKKTPKRSRSSNDIMRGSLTEGSLVVMEKKLDGAVGVLLDRSKAEKLKEKKQKKKKTKSKSLCDDNV